MSLIPLIPLNLFPDAALGSLCHIRRGVSLGNLYSWPELLLVE
jgi:hypothetical protein